MDKGQLMTRDRSSRSLPSRSLIGRFLGVWCLVSDLFHSYTGLTWSLQGNHDSEDTDDRANQMRMLQNMPYSLAQPGPEAVDGVGNCEHEVAEI